MYNYLEGNFSSYSKQKNHETVESLGLQWAKKYLHNLDFNAHHHDFFNNQNIDEVFSQFGREITKQKLRAWKKTEKLPSQEMERHRLNSELIYPWKITGDSFQIYEKALDVYIQQTLPSQPSMVTKLAYEGALPPESLSPINNEYLAIRSCIGASRQTYTQKDPQSNWLCKYAISLH